MQQRMSMWSPDTGMTKREFSLTQAFQEMQNGAEKQHSRGLAADHRRVARPKCWLCRHNVARLTAQLSIAIARPSQSDHMTRPAWQETNIVLSTFIPKPGPESGGDDAVLQHSVSERTCVGNVSEDCIGAPERSSLDLSTNKNSV